MWRWCVYVLACGISLAMAVTLMIHSAGFLYPEKLVFSFAEDMAPEDPRVSDRKIDAAEVKPESDEVESVQDVLRHLLRLKQ